MQARTHAQANKPAATLNSIPVHRQPSCPMPTAHAHAYTHTHTPTAVTISPLRLSRYPPPTHKHIHLPPPPPTHTCRRVKNASSLPQLPSYQALHEALAGTYNELRRMGQTRAALTRPVHTISDAQQVRRVQVRCKCVHVPGGGVRGRGGACMCATTS
jgi:hypothetical protein